MPLLPDPYPAAAGVSITDFTYVQALIVRREAIRPWPGVEWLVHEDYSVRFRLDGVDTTLTVPAGTWTDFSSVPQALQSILSKLGPHAEASVVHDYLYDAWKLYRMQPRHQDQDFADRLFRAGIAAAGLDPVMVEIAYMAVRDFGWERFSARAVRAPALFQSRPRST